MKVKATFLLDKEQVAMVPMLFVGAELVSVGESDAARKKDTTSVFRRTGLTKHQHLFKMFTDDPKLPVRWKDIGTKLSELGYSSSNVGATIDDFLKAGIVARVERGRYRLTAVGLQTKMEDIATIDWPSNAYFTYRASQLQNNKNKSA